MIKTGALRWVLSPRGASCPSARRAPVARTFCRLTRDCLPPRGLSPCILFMSLEPSQMSHVPPTWWIPQPCPFAPGSCLWLLYLSPGGAPQTLSAFNVAFRLTVQSSWWCDHTEEFLTIEAPLPLQLAAVLYWGLILIQQKRDFRSQMFSLQIKYPLAKCVIKVSECLSRWYLVHLCKRTHLLCGHVGFDAQIAW